MRKYYYSVGKDRKGPFTLDELKSVDGFIPESLVWYAGLPSWVRADALPELSELFVTAAPPPLPGVSAPPPLPKVSRPVPHAVHSPRVESGIKRPYLLVGIASVSVILLLVLGYYFVSNRSYSGGKGTLEKPYLISSLTDMESLAENVNAGHTYKDTCFLLTCDLVETGDTVSSVIGTADRSFLGTFDGGGHSVAASIGVHVSEISDPCSGLFVGGVIKNLTVAVGEVGTPERPYLISSRADMEVLAANVDAGHRYKDTCFLLTRDLSEADDLVTTIIGTSEELYFSGTFDGGGHCIAVDINNTGGKYQFVGIFGHAEEAVINNLSVSGRISSPVIDGGDLSIGGICGLSDRTITISNCHNQAKLFVMGAVTSVGGIAGAVESGTISNCSNQGLIISEGNKMSFTGGICGLSNGTITISNCHNLGEISLFSFTTAGGISGIFSGTISNCSNRGEIIFEGNDAKVGGICGQFRGIISNCYNAGRIASEVQSSTACIGSITGLVERGGMISNGYNTGEISAIAKHRNSCGFIGSIAGFNRGIIKNCFAANENMLIKSTNRYGRIVGFNYSDDGEIVNCYASSSMLINNKPAGSGKVNGTSSSSSNFKDQSWLESKLGWDFSIWVVSDNDYPVLRSESAH